MIALPIDWLYPPPDGWTLQDLERLPEGSRVEVIDGSLIVNPAPLATHQRIARRLATQLEPQLPPEWQVEMEVDVMLAADPLDYVAPDVVVFSSAFDGNTRPIPGKDVALVVEVVSMGSRRYDRALKPVVYAQAGIPHYWRIEGAPVGAPVTVVHVFSGPTLEGYSTERVYEGRLVEADPFPLEVDLTRLLAARTR
jgi:Uma2 family endonuclease